MDPRLIARLIALGRVAVGTGFTVAPQLTGPLWIGGAGRKPGAQFYLRLVGVRDLVLAAGALAALSGRGSARQWVLAGAAADAGDLAATLIARDELPPLALANALAVTVGAVALGVGAAAALD